MTHSTMTPLSDAVLGMGKRAEDERVDYLGRAGISGAALAARAALGRSVVPAASTGLGGLFGRASEWGDAPWGTRVSPEFAGRVRDLHHSLKLPGKAEVYRAIGGGSPATHFVRGAGHSSRLGPMYVPGVRYRLVNDSPYAAGHELGHNAVYRSNALRGVREYMRRRAMVRPSQRFDSDSGRYRFWRDTIGRTNKSIDSRRGGLNAAGAITASLGVTNPLVNFGLPFLADAPKLIDEAKASRHALGFAKKLGAGNSPFKARMRGKLGLLAALGSYAAPAAMRGLANQLTSWGVSGANSLV